MHIFAPETDIENGNALQGIGYRVSPRLPAFIKDRHHFDNLH